MKYLIVFRLKINLGFGVLLFVCLFSWLVGWLVVVVFQDRVSLCTSPGCPGTGFVDQF